MKNSENNSILSIFNFHERYREASLENRLFGHQKISNLIAKFCNQPIFDLEEKGFSAEGRDISIVRFGHGSTKIMCWSQMHGNEATATMALIDLFHFFSADDENNDFRNFLLNNITFYFLPLLNPDGAAKFTRENALSIDLNRDALIPISPEAKILKNAILQIKPKFGFNLHDQDIKYTVGNSKNNAAISFLAPAFDYKKNINLVRENGMKLIAASSNELKLIIPENFSRYDDSFEPRAFGDNIMKWGTSSILIETGGWKSDTEKQFLRKINFSILLTAFKMVATESYTDKLIHDYFNIPENSKRLFDLKLCNVNVQIGNQTYKVDVGINREEKFDEISNSFYYLGTVEEVGDLSTFGGYDEFDCSDYSIYTGKIKKYDADFDFENAELQNFFNQNYTGVEVKNDFSCKEYLKFPFNVHRKYDEVEEKIKKGMAANFLLQNSEKTEIVVINGFISKNSKDDLLKNVINGAVYK